MIGHIFKITDLRNSQISFFVMLVNSNNEKEIKAFEELKKEGERFFIFEKITIEEYPSDLYIKEDTVRFLWQNNQLYSKTNYVVLLSKYVENETSQENKFISEYFEIYNGTIKNNVTKKCKLIKNIYKYFDL